MTKNSGRKLNNRGFSLIELIVSIAIMVILTAIATASYAVLDNSYVKDAERGLADAIAVTRTRAMSVAATEWRLTVTKETDGTYYACIYKTVQETATDGSVSTTRILHEKEELGNKLTISFGSGKGTEITKTKELSFVFDPATGKIKSVVLGGVPQTASMTSGIGNITISRNDYKVKLKVYYNTGKCERE